MLKLQIEVDETELALAKQETNKIKNKSKEPEIELINYEANKSNAINQNKLNYSKSVNMSNIDNSNEINNISSSKRILYKKTLGAWTLNLNKDRHINHEIKNVIEFKQKKRKDITINYSSVFNFEYFKCCKDNDKNKLSRNELIELAMEEIFKKTDIRTISKTEDKLNLLINILLTKNQKFMLNNRETKVIINKIESRDIVGNKTILDEKHILKKENLFKHIAANYHHLNLIDEMLLKYLDKEMKEELMKKFHIEV